VPPGSNSGNPWTFDFISCWRATMKLTLFAAKSGTLGPAGAVLVGEDDADGEEDDVADRDGGTVEDPNGVPPLVSVNVHPSAAPIAASAKNPATSANT
jgi:hypothetical protein